MGKWRRGNRDMKITGSKLKQLAIDYIATQLQASGNTVKQTGLWPNNSRNAFRCDEFQLLFSDANLTILTKLTFH